MLRIVTLDSLLQQTNALTADSSLIQEYGEVAEAQVLHDSGWNEDELIEAKGTYPPQMRQAVRLLVGHYYRVREAVAPNNNTPTALGYKHLIAAVRHYPKDWRNK